ncbi:transcription factor IIIB 50 kDa subunit [Salarias fasciatus]|uniref:Transcription factor IIIB 50 kDa subunit n=1 Tax=Salarias fasciatus TaxID=181472 RepID=A0A672FIZ0_SALFA|nr:transcription factor IIIB 50 kDa subunit [Salarias fasciatus]
MMCAAGLRCPGCGSSNVVEDDLYSQAQMVCVDCGSVVSEGTLAQDPLDGTAVSYSRSTAVSKKPCRNLIEGLQRVKAICRILRVNESIEELSDKYYNQAYRHQSFINVTLHKKHILAGCCVLISCRLCNWPVTMGTIGYLVDADPVEVGGIYQDMVKVLDVNAPIVCITDVMQAHSQEYKISATEVPDELSENSRDLTKRAVALVELAADAWIVTGRQPTPIMMAAVYLAWQSLKPSKLRLGFSLSRFCQLARVKQHKPAMKRVAEMKEVLCKLGKELPWSSEAVTPDSVVHQVGDILQNRNVLLRKALESHEEALQASRTEEAAASQIPEPGAQTADELPVQQNGKNAERTEQRRDGDGDPRTGLQRLDSPDSNWGKRELFAPPCVIHCKRKRVEQPDVLRDVTGDEEISDSEIDSYIRSPQESREFALSQRILSEMKKP